MLYEIKLNTTQSTGKNFQKSYITTEIEFTTRNGLDAVKFLQEGKSRYNWIEIPNEFQMKNYYKSFEVVITEATTGRRIHTISK